MIVGIDEVGRGPWAGPLVMGAVVLGGAQIDGLTDSKKLSKKRREQLDIEIRNQAVGIGLGWVHSHEIDTLGLASALELACRKALEALTVPYSEIIIDGTQNFLKNTGKGPYVTTLKKADLLVPSVSAASIVAKVARDAWMAEQDKDYPGYGFGAHAGYGTAAHLAALQKLGVTPLHRQSFAPIAAINKQFSTSPDTRQSNDVTQKTTKTIGDLAEDAVAKWLETSGYRVLERNWKTKYCEIDIVAASADKLYFVEVKHRRSADRGGGIAAITKQKLRQMNFAAKLYLANDRLQGSEAQLAVATTYGDPAVFEQFLLLE